VAGNAIILLGEIIYERCYRKVRQGGGHRGMVDFYDRRRAAFDSVDRVSAGHVRTSCMDVVVVGAGAGRKYDLAIYPDSVVLGMKSY
jgi:glycerol dehydrogenase-like iron-containing ADH family enzyme